MSHCNYWVYLYYLNSIFLNECLIHHSNSGPSFEGRNTVIVFTDSLISSRALGSQFARIVKIKLIDSPVWPGSLRIFKVSQEGTSHLEPGDVCTSRFSILQLQISCSPYVDEQEAVRGQSTSVWAFSVSQKGSWIVFITEAVHVAFQLYILKNLCGAYQRWR